MRMTPLEAPSLIDQVYRRLLEAITDHSLPPGFRIRQGEIADRLRYRASPSATLSTFCIDRDLSLRPVARASASLLSIPTTSGACTKCAAHSMASLRALPPRVFARTSLAHANWRARRA